MEEIETTLGNCVDCQEQGPSRCFCSSDLRSPDTQGTYKFPQPLFGVPKTLSLPSRQCQGRMGEGRPYKGPLQVPDTLHPQPHSLSLSHLPAPL